MQVNCGNESCHQFHQEVHTWFRSAFVWVTNFQWNHRSRKTGVGPTPYMEASHESTQPVWGRVKLTQWSRQQFHQENGSVVCGSVYGSLTSSETTLSRKTHGPTWRHMSQHNRSGDGSSWPGACRVNSFTGKILISPLSSIFQNHNQGAVLTSGPHNFM